MSSLQNLILDLIKSDVALEIKNIMDKYISKCSTFLEFGSRGAFSGIIALGALDLGRNKSSFRPRFVCIDLMHDDSITKMEQLAKMHSISFQFWKGHSSQYPIHETDGIFWDCFHSGGALFEDLNHNAPYINKYILIMGVGMFGDKSEAVVNGMDINAVARELHVDADSAKMGMKAGIEKFLELNKDWKQIKVYKELCVLERILPSDKTFFKDT